MKKCRIAFCGTGKWVGMYHLPELRKRTDRFEIIGFYDIFQEKARQAAAEGQKAYQSLEELAGDPQVDTVVIATKPVETHFENTMALIEAGKNIILEKPMTYSSSLCDELIAAARRKGVLFTVNHNLRCSLCFKAVQEVLRQGHAGKPVCVDIVSPRSWYDEHDFSNYAVHMTDQALALNRSPLKEVSAFFVHPDQPMNLCGYGEALLRFEEPPVIRVSIRPCPQKQPQPDDSPFRGYFRLAVCGTEDTFAVDDLPFIPSGEDLLCGKYYYYDNAAPDFSRPDFVRSLDKGYYDYYYESWAEGAPLLIAPEAARNVIRCLELMNESARRGCAVPATGMLPAPEEVEQP